MRSVKNDDGASTTVTIAAAQFEDVASRIIAASANRRERRYEERRMEDEYGLIGWSGTPNSSRAGAAVCRKRGPVIPPFNAAAPPAFHPGKTPACQQQCAAPSIAAHKPVADSARQHGVLNRQIACGAIPQPSSAVGYHIACISAFFGIRV